MKKIALVFSMLFLMGCGSFIEWKQAQKGIQASEPIIISLEKFKGINGVYPDALDKLNLPIAERDNIEKYGISYKAWNNQSMYAIGFEMWGPPFNPWCGYGSNEKKWQCLGK